MVVKNGLACGIMLALVGCATKPVSNEQATPVPEKQIISTALLEKRDGTGEVIIKRDSGLGTAQKVVVYPTIGDHVFSAWPKGVCGGGMSEQAGKVTTDRTLMYRIGYGSNGEYGIHPTAF